MASSVGRGWRVWTVAAAVAACGLLPGPALAAFASALVQNVAQPFQSVFDGLGGTAPRARVVFSGGGPLLPWQEGQGSFIVAASASNAGGDLHASVDLSSVGRGTAAATAQASIVDTLTFGGSRPVDLALRLAVQGSFFGNGDFANFSVTSGLTVGDTSSQATQGWFYSNGASNPQRLVQLSHTSGDVRAVSREPGNAVLWLTTRMTVLPGTPVPVHAFLNVSASIGENSTALADFGHTAQLWLGLPADTPFTSRSGVFLDGAPRLPVPEPHRVALLAVGLLLLAAWRRRCLAHGLLLSGLLLVPAAARADAGATMSVFTGNPSFLHLFHSESDDVLGSGTARVSHSGQIQPAGADPFSWIAGSWGSTRRGAAGAEIVADRGDRAVQGEIVAHAVVSDTIHIHGQRAGIAVFSAGVFGSFDSLSGSRFQADGSLSVVAPAGSHSADVRFLWTKDIGTRQPSVTATQGTTGIRNDPANLSAILHVPVLVQPGDDVQVQLFVSAHVRPAANDHAVASFGHTMQLAIALPEGLSYTSASGDFMVDAQPLPVPEPGRTGLLLAGLLGLAVCRCGRRRHARPVPILPALLGSLGLLFAGSAQAISSASVSSNTFSSGLFEATDFGPLARAAVALSGAGPLSTGPGEGSFLATAEADLRRGTLRASAEASTTGRGVTAAVAGASFNDQLSFDNTRVVTVTLQLAVHGAFDGLGAVAGRVRAGLLLGGERLEADLRWNTDAAGLPTASVRLMPTEGGTSATRQVALRSGLPANTLAWISLTRDVEPGRLLSVAGWMEAVARANTNAIASVSFGNTAQLALLVPDGVTVRSVSGHFLVEPPAPVPEPGRAWLLAGGLAVAWPMVLRRRRRGHAIAAGSAAAARRAATLPR